MTDEQHNQPGSKRRVKKSLTTYMLILFASAILLLLVAYFQERAYAQAGLQLFHVKQWLHF